MASFVYTPAKKSLLDSDTLLTDVRLLLVMTNTTADTDQDVKNIDDIGTLDECDGANYVRKAVGSEATSQDDPNNRAEFTFAAVTWTALGNGTRQLDGIVMYQHVVDDTDALLIAFIDPTGWPLNPGGADLTVTPNAEGVLQLT